MSKANPTAFSGNVHSVVFENPAQSFYVLRMSLDVPDADGLVSISGLRSTQSFSTVTVRGNVPGIPVKVGTWFSFQGNWVIHKVYGKQISITRAPVFDTWTPEIAIKTLVNHGVPNFHLQTIMEHTGREIFLEVLRDPDLLADIPGIKPAVAQNVTNRWRAVVTLFQTIDFLRDLNLPSSHIDQIITTFGDDMQKVLSTNPWRLVEIDGITFKEADSVARYLKLDCSDDNLDRIRGAVLFATRTSQGMGHLYSMSGEVYQKTRYNVPRVSELQVGKALAQLHTDKLLYIDRQSEKGLTAIYTPWLYQMEEKSAQILCKRLLSAAIKDKRITNYKRSLLSLSSKDDVPNTSLRKIVEQSIERHSKASKIDLSTLQKEGVFNSLLEPVSIITGLPGTGKTTSLRMVVRVLKDAGIDMLLVAPTGIAAKRMSSLTGTEASTIHRAFSAKGISSSARESTYSGIIGTNSLSNSSDGSEQGWGYSPKNPHSADVVIVDESSMLDQHLMYRLLHCTKKSCRMIFVGDAAQLPSVGPGNVLRDLIRSDLFATVQLTDIYRQAETSDIVSAAHEIHRGEYPHFEKSKEFMLLEVGRPYDICSVIEKLASKLYNKRQVFQILSPRHGGEIGVTNLNNRIRELLNPKQPGAQEMRVGSETLRENDRIMVVRNDYRLEIFNGDVGKITRINRATKEVQIKIHGPPVLYVNIPITRVGSLLRLAYAMTIHKSQGQEYNVIVMPIHDQFGPQLQRNLIYTAVTRAKEKVILVGTTTALSRAVQNNKEIDRRTLFRHRIENSCTK